MKKNVFVTSILLSFVAMMSCGDDSTAPGTGPGFGSKTAAQIWKIASFAPYVPKELYSSDRTVTPQTANCAGTGTATLTGQLSGLKESFHVSYSKCNGYDPNSLDDEQNLSLEGKYSDDVSYTYALSSESSSGDEDGTYHQVQHMSFSGTIGFSADCDYTAVINHTVNSGLPSYTGSCTYVDSTGKTLSIHGDAMTKDIADAFAQGSLKK